MTYKEIQDFLIETVRDARTEKIANIKTIINKSMETAAGKRDWPGLMMSYDLALAQSTAEYYLPDYVNLIRNGKIDGETDPMEEMPNDLFEEKYPDADDLAEDTPTLWIPKRIEGCKAQPSAASALTIVSDSASDTGATLAVRITGLVSGIEQEESISPTGVAGAAGSLSFTRIYSIDKTAAWTGTCTITSNAGAVTNAVLSPKILKARHILLRVHPIADATYTMNMNIKRMVYPMIDDNDRPANMADEEFTNALLGIAQTLLTGDAKLGDLTVPHVMARKNNPTVVPAIRRLDRQAYRTKYPTGRKW